MTHSLFTLFRIFQRFCLTKILIKNIIHVNKCEQLNCFAVFEFSLLTSSDLCFHCPFLHCFCFRFFFFVIYFLCTRYGQLRVFIVYSAKRGEDMNETALSAVQPSHRTHIFIPSSHLFSNYLRSVVAISHVNYAKISTGPAGTLFILGQFCGYLC